MRLQTAGLLLRHIRHHTFGTCPICGRASAFLCTDPHPVFSRNNMLCLFCKSSARNRHVAREILVRKGNGARSIRDLSLAGSFKVYNTSTDNALSRVLLSKEVLVCSDLLPGIAPGTLIRPRVWCQDLQRLTFEDASFDIVVTEDVLEHVRDHVSALREIYRVLKPGGLHVFTIPFLFDRPTVTRIDTSGAEDLHLLPPEYHGDPLRGAIIVYRTFGLDLYPLLASLGFSTEVVLSTSEDLKRHGICDNWVFVSTRPA